MKIATINHASWNDLKSQLKIRYPVLKDADLRCEDGQEEEMLRMVEYKLRKTKQEMKDIIKKL